MAKTEEEKKIGLGLAGPSIWQSGKTPVPPEDDGRVVPEGSEGVADISPGAISDAQQFARDMIVDGRRGDGTGNEFFPSKKNSQFATDGGQFQISPTVSDGTNNVFAASENMAFNDENAQYQLANSTPGVTPNFFKSSADGEKIDDIIDKTGNTEGKTAKDIVDGAEKIVGTAVQNQLSAENDFEPNETYVSKNKSSTDPLEALSDVLYNRSKRKLGVSENNNAAGTLGNLLGNAEGGTLNHPPVSSNEYSPPSGFQSGPVAAHKKGDSISTPDNANQFANASDMAFNDQKAQYQLANSTPGIGPNFFKSSAANEKIGDLIDKTGADELKDVKALYAKADATDDGSPGDLTVAVQSQLAANNAYDPNEDSSPYTSKNTSSEANFTTDKLYSGDQNTLGRYSSDGTGVSLGDLNSKAGSSGPAGDLLGDQRKATHSNTYSPDSSQVFIEAHAQGDVISPVSNGADGKVFASSVDDDGDAETAEVLPQSLQSTGMGLPAASATPGTGEGQTLGTFFTKDQVDALLDKTGGTPGDGTPANPSKMGSDLFSSSKVTQAASSVQSQLDEGNKYHPNLGTSVGEYETAALVELPNGNISESPATDIGMPGSVQTKGVYDPGSEQRSTDSLARHAEPLLADENTNFPVAHGQSVTFSGAEDEIIAGAGDNFFKTPTELTFPAGTYNPGGSTPGVGNSFFTPAQVDGTDTASGFDVIGDANNLLQKASPDGNGNPGIVNTATQTQLAAGNVNDPDDPHTTVGGSQIDFPEPGNSSANTNEPTYPAEQTQKGKFSQTSDVQAHTSFASQQSTAAADLSVNQNHPSLPIIQPNAETLVTSDAQSKIIAGAGDDFFQPPTIDTDVPPDGVNDKLPQAVTYTGLGVPKTEGGEGSPTTKLGTFFTQAQIDAVLNKEASLVGADDKTLPGGELFSSANLNAIESNVENQLEAANINTPNAEHTLLTNIDFPKPTDEKGSQAREVSYPGDQAHKGGYVKPDSDKTFAAHVVDQTNNDTAKYTGNTYHPTAPSNVEGVLSPSPSDADSFITPGTDDKFFATDSQLAGSPGTARPNFFTEQDPDRIAFGTPIVPKNVPLTEDNFNAEQQAIYEGDVRAKLGAENFFYPKAGDQNSVTQTQGATEGLVDKNIEFPDLSAQKSAGGTGFRDPASIPDLSAALLGEKENERKTFDETELRAKADDLLDSNAYRPRRQGGEVSSTSVANIIRKATEAVVETTDEEGKITKAGDAWFVPEQSNQLGIRGTVGKSIEDSALATTDAGAQINLLKDTASAFGTPSGGVGTENNPVYSSKLVSETGPDDSADVIKVPKPGEKLETQYSAIQTSQDPHSVITTALEMLKDQNIYHPTNESPFFRDSNFFKPPGDDKNAPNENLQPMFSIQRALGKFVKPSPVEEAGEGEAKKVSKDQVTIGDMIKFSQAFRLLGTGDTINAGHVLNGGAGISVIENPLVQMGLEGVDLTITNFRSIADRASRADLKAKLEAATGTKDFVPANSTSILERASVGDVGQSNSIGKNAASFGQLNNYYEPFGNGVLLDSIGMLALAALAIIVMLAFALLLEVIVSNTMTEQFSNDRNPIKPETMAFGRNAGVIMLGDGTDGGSGGVGAGQAIIDFFLEDFMRVPRTDYALLEAIAHGMTLMLGFPSGLTSTDVGFGLSTGQGLVDFAINLLTAPAYYLNYVRQITMSGQLVAAEFKGIGGAAAQGPEKFFQSLDKLFNSKFIRFIFISAQVGDQNLKSLFGNTANKSERLYQLKNKGGASPQTTDPALLSQATKDALGGKGQLSVDESTANDLQVMARLRGNLTRWGNKHYKNPLSLSTFLASSVSDTRVKALLSNTFRYLKVDPDNIEHLERAINAEYMPFYFHDLRTHEIISIPAFVTAFDESYAVNYNSYNTYGRQDPVRIYTGAERTINLGFKLVAFNETDFKALWYTVNKFVSMVYPQYSKGVTRKLTDSSGVEIDFVQPFSQVPAASPLIRIRLGDLYRSNYSTSGLKRLFGLTGEADSSFKVDTKALTEERYQAALTDKIVDLVSEAEAKLLEGKIEDTIGKKRLLICKTAFRMAFGEITWIQGGGSPDADGFIGTDTKLLKIQTNTGEGSKLELGLDQDAALVFVCEKVDGEPKTDEDGKIVSMDGTFQVYQLSKLLNGNLIPLTAQSVKLKVKDPTDYMGITPAEHILALKALDSPLVKDAKEDAAVKNLKPEDADARTTENFFKAENNAVRRSFESTRGTGLAGFITSLSLTYGEAVWETKASHGRAPKEVDISMTFAPIHDLPLGLDHNGRLRSLSHPAAINHGKTTDGAEFTTTYAGMDKVDGGEQVSQALDIFDKANRGIDDASSSAFGNRPPKTDA